MIYRCCGVREHIYISLWKQYARAPLRRLGYWASWGMSHVLHMCDVSTPLTGSGYLLPTCGLGICTGPLCDPPRRKE